MKKYEIVLTENGVKSVLAHGSADDVIAYWETTKWDLTKWIFDSIDTTTEAGRYEYEELEDNIKIPICGELYVLDGRFFMIDYGEKWRLNLIEVD